jgi:hypothetical protein
MEKREMRGLRLRQKRGFHMVEKQSWGCAGMGEKVKEGVEGASGRYGWRQGSERWGYGI